MQGVVDPHVKGTAVLTDTDALTELLGTTNERLLRRPYLRWKPGTSCIAALELASGPAYAAAFSSASEEKLAKTREQAPAGSVLLVDQELCVLVARPSADRDLPALRDLTGAVARVQRNHPAMGGVPADPPDAVHTLAYKPHRRWVGVLSCGEVKRYVLRAYRPSDGERAWTSLKLARKRLGDLVPEPVGRSRSQGLLVQAWVPGEPLDRVLLDQKLLARPDLADTLPTIGRTLAGVHSQRPSRSAARLGGARLDAAAGLLGALDQDMGSWAAHLATRLEGYRPQQDQSVFLHGDFSADQVVLGPQGPVFLDWDRAGVGAAAVDLASLRAAGLNAADWQRVLDGYGEVRPLPGDLDWYVAAALLERAAEPFRTGHCEWLKETSRLLAGVQQLLS
jgi:aminoglycoside phosphotransferase (APT) family kinase protein